MKTRRIVVVGLGSIGRRHARLLKERNDLEVEACEPSVLARDLALAESGPMRIHADFESALASRPDAVLIATPHSQHPGQAIAALRNGAHVLCEKPLCIEPGQAAEMVACARETGRTLAVGFQLHFQAGVLRCRELIREGRLGNLAHLHVRVGSYVTLRNSLSRYQESLEGALLLDYAHQTDLLLWLLGALPAGVTVAALKTGVMPLSSTPNVLTLTLDYAQPLLATVHLNYLQMPQRHEWEIVGDKGWVVMDPDRGTLRLGLRESEREVHETFATDRDHDYRLEHQAFLDCVDGLRAPESSSEAAARSVELYAMAMRSWKEGRRVPCEWLDFGGDAVAPAEILTRPDAA